MRISEDSGKSWHNIPEWADFFLNQGRSLEVNSGNKGRKLRIISMPCRSHAAALIALGAVCRGLSDKEANDRNRHLGGLFSYAKQYLRYCKSCNVKPCNPKIKKCGFISEATGKLKMTDQQTRNRYVSEMSDEDFRNRIFKIKDIRINKNETVITDETHRILPNLYLVSLMDGCRKTNGRSRKGEQYT